MKISTRRAFVQLVVAVACTSCSEDSDTCSGGLNMQDPMLAAGLEGSADSPAIRIVWSAGSGPGADLPQAYFAAVRVDPVTPSAVRALITSVGLSADREITVRFRPLDDFLATASTLEFMLVFPDREAFVSCEHPGMNDRYQLKVSLRFQDDAMIAADFDETRFAGAL